MPPRPRAKRKPGARSNQKSAKRSGKEPVPNAQYRAERTTWGSTWDTGIHVTETASASQMGDQREKKRRQEKTYYIPGGSGMKKKKKRERNSKKGKPVLKTRTRVQVDYQPWAPSRTSKKKNRGKGIPNRAQQSPGKKGIRKVLVIRHKRK